MTGYTLPVQANTTDHWSLLPRFVHDIEGEISKAEIDALVASGDYFGALATSLDSLSQMLEAAGNEIEHFNLEKIITTLLYIESKYTITKK